jgi:hypothetical protein
VIGIHNRIIRVKQKCSKQNCISGLQIFSSAKLVTKHLENKLKAEGRVFDSRWGNCIFFNWPTPSTRLAIDSAPNRYGYRDSSWEGVTGGRLFRPTSLQFLSRLSRKCERLDVSQPHGIPQPVIKIAILYPQQICFPTLPVQQNLTKNELMWSLFYCYSLTVCLNGF